MDLLSPRLPVAATFTTYTYVVTNTPSAPGEPVVSEVDGTVPAQA
jgi:hypothetical protein